MKNFKLILVLIVATFYLRLLQKHKPQSSICQAEQRRLVLANSTIVAAKVEIIQVAKILHLQFFLKPLGPSCVLRFISLVLRPEIFYASMMEIVWLHNPLLIFRAQPITGVSLLRQLTAV